MTGGLLRAVLEDVNAPYAEEMRVRRIDAVAVGVLWGHFVVYVALALGIVFLGLDARVPEALRWTRVPASGIAGGLALAYVAAAVPGVLRTRMANRYAWRAVATAALTLDAFVLIFLSGGVIEAHFHLFLVVAFVTIYADWRLPWIATALTILHHATLNALEPSWLFWYGRNEGATLVHAVPMLAVAGFATVVARSHRETLARQVEARAGLSREKQEHEALLRELELERGRLRAIVEALPVGVVLGVPDPSGYRVVLANGMVERILRHPFRTGGRLAQYPTFEGYHPDGRPYGPHEWPLVRALAAGERVDGEEIVVHRADGTRGLLSVHASPVAGPDGATAAAVMVFVDVTDLREATSRLEASKRAALVQERMAGLGALVAGVAHEVRTPLTYVANNVHLMAQRAHREARERPELEPMARHLEALGKEAVDGIERIVHLVRNLRQVTRTEPGAREVRGLNEVVANAVALFRATHRSQVRVLEDLRATPLCDVDPLQIQQVVLNLLLNAAEAMPSGGTIRVATRPAPGGGELVVQDEGAGIPVEVRPRLFDPFFTTKQEGMGLGLPIARKIVEAHGGSIRYETVLARGTTFVVFLPEAPSPRREATAAAGVRGR